MEFLRDLWTLLVNAFLGRELEEEEDPYVFMDDLPVVRDSYEGVEPTAAVDPQPYFLEDLPLEPILPVVRDEGIAFANPEAIAKATIVD